VNAATRADGPTTIEAGVPRRRGRVAASVTPAGRDELVDAVARDLDCTKADSRQIVEAVARAISALVASRQLVRVPHLGNFRSLDTGTREGRNPRTGEPVTIAPGRRVTFRAAKSLKSGLNLPRAGRRA
jgi:DNA-binding protein HU-beta